METPVKLPLKDFKVILCPACKSKFFEMQYELRLLPAVLSRTLKPEIIPTPVFICAHCKAVFTPVSSTLESKTEAQA